MRKNKIGRTLGHLPQAGPSVVDSYDDYQHDSRSSVRVHRGHPSCRCEMCRWNIRRTSHFRNRLLRELSEIAGAGSAMEGGQ